MLNSLEPEGALAETLARVAKRVDNLESMQFGGTISVAIIEDQKAAGTNGGGLTAGSFATRTLNTIVSDPDGIVSLASDRFTLQSGIYLIHTKTGAINVDSHKTRIRDITNGVTVGVSLMSYTVASAMSYSSISALVTVTASTDFELQHRVHTTNAFALGFGKAWGEVEVYASVEIIKLG